MASNNFKFRYTRISPGGYQPDFIHIGLVDMGFNPNYGRVTVVWGDGSRNDYYNGDTLAEHTYQDGADSHLIEIVDRTNGWGISDKDIGNIFDLYRFYRAFDAGCRDHVSELYLVNFNVSKVERGTEYDSENQFLPSLKYVQFPNNFILGDYCFYGMNIETLSRTD